MSKPRKYKTLADMSLPAGQRAKGRKPGRVATPPAQLGHASSPRAVAVRRDGLRWLAAETARRAGQDVEIVVVSDEAGGM